MESESEESKVDPLRDRNLEVDAVTRLLMRALAIVGVIVIVPILAIGVMICVYLWLLLHPDQGDPAALQNIQALLSSTWGQLLPVATQIVRILSPILVLILVVAGFRLLERTGGSSTRLHEVLGDLPSILALTIVISICILPLAGISIPDVLNNVALVVVGFYFGRGRPGFPGSPATAAGTNEG